MKLALILKILLTLFLLNYWSCSNDSDITDDSEIHPPINIELYTYVPDDAFENALINRGYDDVLDDYVLTSNIENVTELILYSCGTGWGGADCGGIGINDLTGIEDFINLESLNIRENNLKTLDVSNNTALIGLNCGDNNLTSLDVSNNLNLEYLGCYGNQLSFLDVTGNLNLKVLSIGSDLQYYLANNISTLDLSNNVNLETLDCTNNALLSLEISNCVKLENLYIRLNNLSALDISNNINLIRLNCTQNPLLECVKVNQEQLNYHAWFHVDPNVVFSLDCNN